MKREPGGSASGAAIKVVAVWVILPLFFLATGGSLALYLATPVALGSFWAVIPALAFVPILVLRIRNEEAVLARDLPG